MIEVSPMLCQTGSESDLDKPQYAEEPKLDGTRIWIVKEAEKISIFGRPKDDGTISNYTEPLSDVVNAARMIPAGEFVIDAEAVVYKDGRTWFEGSQRRCSVQDKPKIRDYQVLFPMFALSFDLMRLDGKWTIDYDYLTRKNLLRDLLDETPQTTIQYLEHYVDDKRRHYEEIVGNGEEGVILKRLDSRYQPGRRSPCWLKVKKWHEERVLVVGYTLGEGRRGDVFGSLILAKTDMGGHLKYVGKVGTGFNDEELKRIYGVLKTVPPMIPAIDARDSNEQRIDYTPVKIDLEVVVKFFQVSKNGVYRFPSLVKDRLGNNQIHFGKTIAAKPKVTDLSDMLKELVK